MKSILSYTDGNSVLHKLNPLTKIFIAICICVAAFMSDNLWFLLALVSINLGIGVLGGTFRNTVAVFIGLIKISLFILVLQLLFVRSGEPIFTIPLINFSITNDGLSIGVLAALRLVTATMPLSALLMVTKVTDLSNALVKNLGIPYKYAFTFSTAIRFIPIFSEEMTAIAEAQSTRGVDFSTKNIFKKIKLIAPLCIPLLITSVNKISNSAIAAETRGFNLRTRKSGYKSYSYRLGDIGAMILSVSSIIVAVLV